MKIAVFRAARLGDLLCAVPALRALRGAYPEAEITLIGLPWAREVAARLPQYVNDFVEFPGFPGLPERAPDVAAMPDFFLAMRARQLDVVLQMHGSGEIANPLAVLLGARATAGYCRPGHYRPMAETFFEWRDEEHEVMRWLRLLELLGIPPRGTHLELPLHEHDWQQWRALRLGDYAVIHPGSRLASRRWPAERFAEVADSLAAEGLRVVLTGTAGEVSLLGTAGEVSLLERVKGAMREPALDLAGRTTLGQLAALVARARLLVSNDTGVSHIAAAMRTPSVVVACSSEPKRRAPLNRDLHRVLYGEVSTQDVIRETTRLACAA